jgi:hypothetical protein
MLQENAIVSRVRIWQNRILMKWPFSPEYDEHEYSPRTSEMLAQWTPGQGYGMFGREVETLYKTAKGNYFILSEGGLFSGHYSSRHAETWYGRSVIRPLTEQEALCWCEETGNFETRDEQFSSIR